MKLLFAFVRLALSLVVLWLSAPRVAHAGGLYLMPRGVEAASRAGARVAGSDDPQALWYNPAGLIASDRQLLVDTLLPIGRMEFTRLLESGEYAPSVGATSTIPIPTIGYSDNFGLKDWGFGVGLIVPPGWGGKYPETVDGQPAPQRYSILDADNSYVASLALGVAYSPVKGLSLGVAAYLTAVQIGATVAFSACDYVLCSQPEGSEWEGRARLLLGPVYTGTAVFGAGYAFDWIKLGASLQLKTKIKGDAQFDMALPDQKAFDGVVVENSEGGSDLEVGTEVSLPMIARIGIEFAPIKPLRFELAGTWENWGGQDSLTLEPKGIVVKNVPSVGDITAETIDIALKMRDTWAVQLGGTYNIGSLIGFKRAFFANAGLMFETSAYDPRDLSVTSLDAQKFLLGLGVSIEVARNVLIDVSYGHIFMKDEVVTNSRVKLPSAVQPPPDDEDRPTIGNGNYEMEADFVGLGVRWRLDPIKRSADS